MENICEKKHQLLNQRNLMIALAIAGVLLFVLSPIVYLQNNATTQDRDKILEVSKGSNLPVDIILVKSKIGVIKTDENFSADDGWFKGLSVSVSNKSEKAITYISLRLRFPRPNKQEDDVDFVHSIEYGVNPMLPNTQQIPSSELVPILPEKNVEIKLSDEDYDAIRTALRDSKFPDKIKRIQLTVSMLAFNDGTIWIGGKIYIRDKNKPGNLILLQENNIRTEMSLIPGCYNEIENLQFPYCPPIGEEPPNECHVWNIVLRGSNGNQLKYVNTEQICKTFNRRPCYPITRQRGNLWEDCPTPPDCPCGDCVNGCCYPGRTAKSNESSKGEAANSIPEPCGNSCGLCQQNGGFCDQGGNCVGGSPSPIVIDISGNGFDLTNAANGVLFDIDVDNIREQVSWTTANTDDAWLALDHNQNGRIDSGRELFGNFTPQPTPPQGEERNGFLALAVYDKPANGGNGDRQIDFRDTIFAQLKLWQDRNHNGISEQNELQNLSASPIRVIELNYHESRRTDAHGNQFKYRAKVKDAQGAQVGRWAWDVFLVTAP